RGDYAAADKVLEKAAAKATGTVASQAYHHLARSAFLQGEPTRALENVKWAGDADSESVKTAPSLLFKAQILEKLEKTKDALEAYHQALKVEADSEEALAALVRLSLAVKNRADALKYLYRYAVAMEDDAEGLAQAAQWSLQLGHFDEAFDLADRSRK